jgi:hypothetical protein
MKKIIFFLLLTCGLFSSKGFSQQSESYLQGLANGMADGQSLLAGLTVYQANIPWYVLPTLENNNGSITSYTLTMYEAGMYSVIINDIFGAQQIALAYVISSPIQEEREYYMGYFVGLSMPIMFSSL